MYFFVHSFHSVCSSFFVLSVVRVFVLLDIDVQCIGFVV